MNWILRRLFWHFFWAGTLFHHGKTGQQKIAEQQTGSDVGQSNQDTQAAQGTFGQFEGPVQNSPFYKSLLTTGIQNTSDAYQNAESSMKANANAAGFGYSQPVAQGADNQVKAQEASALAKVPNQAMIAAAPLSMQAGQDSAQLGLGLGNQAQGWNNSAWNMNKARGSWLDTLQQIGPMAANAAAAFA